MQVHGGLGYSQDKPLEHIYRHHAAIASRKPQPALYTLSTTERPRSDELLQGIRNFLRNEASTAPEGRNQFLARVVAKPGDITLRELRDSLCKAIRLGEIDINSPDLHAYLRGRVLA